MARKAAPGTLIHCDACGEDYSATYKRCPFCGEKPENWTTTSIPRVKREYTDDDDFVFDGSDVFEEEEFEEERPARPRGGKRLAQADAPGPINWPRLITFICSLVIIAAALVIVFAVIYPKIHNPNPKPSGNDVVTTPSPSASLPATSDPVEPTDDPSASDPVEPTSPPSQEPTPSTPVDVSVTGLKLSKTDFTLKANESYTIQATVTPADWGGTVTWTSSNTNVATVSANGTVTNVNTSSSLKSVTITATAGNQTVTATVYCRGGSSGTAAPSSNPSSGGGLTLSREDFTLNDTWPTYTFTVTGASGTVTWSVSNSSVATIDQNGKVSKVSAGTCTVTATDSSGQTATCIVRVK